MKLAIRDAINALRPGAECSIQGDDYDGIDWVDKSQTKPLRGEVESKLRELQQLEPARLVRIKRNQLLAESDWTQTRDNVRLNDNAWITYRQELRDISKSASFTTKLNDDVEVKKDSPNIIMRAGNMEREDIKPDPKNKTIEDNYSVLFDIAQGQTMEEMINAQY